MATKGPTAEAAAEAAAILREHDPRTPAEQAAIGAIEQRMWVLYHAHDRDAGVVLLLSRAGLLRDKAHEEKLARAAAVHADLDARDSRVRNRQISFLNEIVNQAAQRLDAGEDPAAVASWMHDQRQAAMQAADAAVQPATP